MEEETLNAKPLIYSHFSSGVGEPKYLACSTWDNLSKILIEALDSYNEVNAAMNLVLFEDAMAHVYVNFGYSTFLVFSMESVYTRMRVY